jgi:hypothetical protein
VSTGEAGADETTKGNTMIVSGHPKDIRPNFGPSVIIVADVMSKYVRADYRLLRKHDVPSKIARRVIWSSLLSGHTCKLAHTERAAS